MLVSSAVVLYLLGDAVVRAGLVEALLLAPWPLLALWGVYLTAFASSLTVDEHGARVQNMLRVVRIPWGRVRELEWRWQVEFTLDDDTRVRSIGGPAQGRAGRRPGRADLTPETMRAQFAYIQRLCEQGRTPPTPDHEGARAVTRGWDRFGVASVTVLVVWAIVAVLVAGGGV